MTWSKPRVRRELKTVALPTSTDISDDGSLLVLLFSSAKIEIWDLSGERAYRSRSFRLGNLARAIALSPDHTALAAAHEDCVEILSLSYYTHVMARKTIPCSGIENLAFSPDGFMLLGTTMRSGKRSTTAIHAMDPKQRSDLKNTHVRLDKIWTSQPLFPNTFENASHAVVLPDSMDGSERRAFAHDSSSGSFCIIDLRSVRITRVVAKDKDLGSDNAVYMALPSLDSAGELAAIAHDASRIRLVTTESVKGNKNAGSQERLVVVPKSVDRVFWVPNEQDTLRQRLVVVSLSSAANAEASAPSNNASITVLDYDIQISDKTSPNQDLPLKAQTVDELAEYTWSLEAELAHARRVGSNSPEGMLKRFVNLTLGRSGSYGLRGIKRVARRGIRNVDDLQEIKNASETAGVAPSSMLAAVDVMSDNLKAQDQWRLSRPGTTTPDRSLSPRLHSSRSTQALLKEPDRKLAEDTQTSHMGLNDSIPDEHTRVPTQQSTNHHEPVKRHHSDPFTETTSNTKRVDDQLSLEKSTTANLAEPELKERNSRGRLKGLQSMMPRFPWVENSSSSPSESIAPAASLHDIAGREKRHSAPPSWINGDAGITAYKPSPPVPAIPETYSSSTSHTLRHTSLPSEQQLASLYRRSDLDSDALERPRSNSAPRAAMGAGRRIAGVDDLQRTPPSKSPSRGAAVPPVPPVPPIPQAYSSPGSSSNSKSSRLSSNYGRPASFHPLKTIPSAESSLSLQYSQQGQQPQQQERSLAPTPTIPALGLTSLQEARMQKNTESPTASGTTTPERRKSWAARRFSGDISRVLSSNKFGAGSANTERS